MKYSTFLLFVLFPLALAATEKGPSHAVLWKPNHADFTLVVPAIGNETCKTAVQNYVAAVNGNDEFVKDMMQGSPLISKPFTCSESLNLDSDRDSFVFLANDFDEGPSDDDNLESAVGSFNAVGVDVYVIPVGAMLRLETTAKKSFLSEINNKFTAMVALGGDDIDPTLYGQKMNGSYPDQIHPTRDRLELEFHRSYLAEGKGVFYGFCRGEQLSAVSQGGDMIQDIPTQIKTVTEHRNWAHHSIQIAEGSQLLQFVDKNSRVTVNSYHHQMVLTLPTDWFVSAYEQHDAQSDRVVEAVERNDGRVVAFQFHPEWMASEDNQIKTDHALGKKILTGMVTYARKMFRK